LSVQVDFPVASPRCKEHPLRIEWKTGWTSGFKVAVKAVGGFSSEIYKPWDSSVAFVNTKLKVFVWY